MLAPFIAAAGLATTGHADAPNYESDVRPIFKANCLKCHNPDKAKGGLDLSTYAATMRGGSSGASVRPGDPASPLLQSMTHAAEPYMPPKADKRPDAEIDIVRKWIEGGLIERAGGVARKATPGADLKVALGPDERPAGPPPMPEGLSTEAVVSTERGDIAAVVAVSPWAPLVAVGGQQQIALYQSDTLELLGILPFPEGVAKSLAFSRNGSLLMAAGGREGASGRAIVWQVKDGKRVAEVGDELDAILTADLSPDQSRIAIGGTDRLIKVLAVPDGKEVSKIKKHTDWVTAVAYSPDGVLLATGDRAGGLVVWEAASGQEFYVLTGHTGAITRISWRRDSNVMASSSEDGTVRLWSMNDGSLVRNFTPHKEGALSVAFTREGGLATCGRDKVARLWDTAGKELRAIKEFPDLTLAVALASEDRRLLIGDWTGHLRVVDAGNGSTVGQLSTRPPSLAERIQTAERAIVTAREQVEKAAAEAQRLEGEAVAKAGVATDRKSAADQAEAKANEAEQALVNANKAVEAAQGKLSGLQAKADAARKDAEAKAQSADAAEKELAGLRQNVTGAEAPLPDLRKAVETASAALNAAKAAVASHTDTNSLPDTQAVVRAEAELQKATGAVAEAEKRVAEAKAQVAAKEGALGPLKQALDAARQAADGAGQEVAVAAQELDKAKQAVQPATAARDQFVAAREAARKELADANTARDQARGAADAAAGARNAAQQQLALSEKILLSTKAAGLDALVREAREKVPDSGNLEAATRLIQSSVKSAVAEAPEAPKPAAATLAEPARVQPPEQPDRALLFLGRFHILLLHLPIGILVAALLLELERWLRRSTWSREAAGQLLVLGAGLMVVTALLGVVLARNGDYEGRTVDLHQWYGFGAAAVIGVAALLRRRTQTRAWPYPAAFATGLVLMVITGHYGGELTHGEGYATKYLADWKAAFLNRAPPAGVASADNGDFATTVQPILDQHCANCHGPTKSKGGYRVDDRAVAFKGGEGGKAAIVPGDAHASELVRRILLPRSNEDAMPPPEKPALKPDQVLALVDWINTGAVWPEAKPVPAVAPKTPAAPKQTAAADSKQQKR